MIKDEVKVKDENYGEDYFKNRKMEMDTYKMVIQWLEKTRPTKVLDYGCGEGHYVHAFNYFGVDCVGYDISDFAINHPYNLANGRVSRTIPEGAFDLVVCMDVLEHVDPIEEAGVLDLIVSKSSKWIILSICDTMLKDVYRDETHINIRPRSYWEYQFTKRGCKQIEVPKDWLYNRQLYLLEVNE